MDAAGATPGAAALKEAAEAGAGAGGASRASRLVFSTCSAEWEQWTGMLWGVWLALSHVSLRDRYCIVREALELLLESRLGRDSCTACATARSSSDGRRRRGASADASTSGATLVAKHAPGDSGPERDPKRTRLARRAIGVEGPALDMDVVLIRVVGDTGPALDMDVPLSPLFLDRSDGDRSALFRELSLT